MRLRAKLNLSFALVAALPILGGAFVARREIVARYQREFASRLDAEERAATREYAALLDELDAKAKRLARADSPLLSGVLSDLARGEVDEEVQRQWLAQVPEEMREYGLDALAVYDKKGTLLASGHFLGRVGDVDQSLDSGLRMEKMLAPGGNGSRDVLIAARVATLETQVGGVALHLRVLVGRTLETALVPRLGVAARILGVSTTPALSGEKRVLRLGEIAGRGPLELELSTPRDELVRAERWIARGALALVASALAFAFLFGTWMAQRISRPILALTDAVRALSAGRALRIEATSHDEVGELGRAFDTMTDELDRAQEELVRAERIAAWREIAQRIAHEIKNPLSPIQMAVETLQRVHRGETKGKVDFDALFTESSATILSEVARLRHIVAEFSRFARMPAPTLARVEINALVEHVLSLYASLPFLLERALAESPIEISADRDQLTQVLVNLLENARDAVTERGALAKVTVETRIEDRYVALAISDNGAGLSDEARGKLFTPYFTTKPRGTGLGLAIVHRIITDHEGTIEFESSLGQGTRVVLRLPRRATP